MKSLDDIWEPAMGGMIGAFHSMVLVYPAICIIWKWDYEMKRRTAGFSKLEPLARESL